MKTIPPVQATASATSPITTAAATRGHRSGPMREAPLPGVGRAPASSGFALIPRRAHEADMTTGDSTTAPKRRSRAAIVLERRDERRIVEIRPEDRHEHEFGVGGLPEQEVGQPHLPGGPDDQVGIGDVRRVEPGREVLLADRVGIDQALAGLRGQTPRRRDDLLARTVVEGDDQGEADIGARERLRLVEQDADVGGETDALADDPHAHPGGVQLGEVVADEPLQEPHEHRHLVRRPAPVLGREAVDGQEAHVMVDRRPHGAAQRLDAAPVAFETGQSTRLGPAAVAVHDDADVRGRLVGARASRGASVTHAGVLG